MAHVLESMPTDPKICAINGGDGYGEIDPAAASQLMQNLGISEETIPRTTIVLDGGKSRLGIRGVAFPDWAQLLPRTKYPTIKDEIDGPVVRLSMQIRGKQRTPDGINKTLVHELEHVAQHKRTDPRVWLGDAAIYGGILAGALTGNRLTRTKHPALQTLATLGGAAIGRQIGYLLAPHERQARQRSREFISEAFIPSLNKLGEDE